MQRDGGVRILFAGQGAVAALSALIWWIAQDGYHALAAVTGGGIALLPAVYMAVAVFSVPADAPPKRVLRAYYRGEVVKLALTVLLFALAVPWFASAFAPLITTYILALLVYVTALLAAPPNSGEQP